MKLYLFSLIGLLLLSAEPIKSPNQFLPTSSEPYFVASGDFNGDGYPDLVVPCRGELISPLAGTPANDQATIYLTNGSPELVKRKDMQVGFGPYTAAVGDLDGDGRPDIVVTNFQSNDGRDLSVMYGSADRSEAVDSAASVKVEGPGLTYRNILNNDGKPVYAFPGLTSVALADFNHDGRLDMAAVAWSSDLIVIFLNEGNRRFRQIRYVTPPGPRDLAIGDFNGDGNLDIAITLYSTNMVQVWNGDGTGAFKSSQLFFSQGNTPYHLKAADLDLDGKLDLVVGNRGPSDNVALFHDEPGGFRYIGSYRPGTLRQGETTADEIRDVVVTDWDHDGFPDLVAACHVSSKLVFWKGTGKNGFNQTFTDRKVLTFPGKGPRSVIPFGGRFAVAFFDSNEVGLISRPD